MTLDPQLVTSLAKKFHTPLYVFEESIVRKRCRELKAALTYPNTVIRYACKALTLRAILSIVRDEGIWIDASSLNEAKRAYMATLSSTRKPVVKSETLEALSGSHTEEG